MFKVIKGKELQEMIDNQEICLRCGCSRKEARDGFACNAWGIDYKKHIWKQPSKANPDSL